MKQMDELTLREKEILFEMELESKEDPLPQEDTDDDLSELVDEEDAYLWDDEEDTPSIPHKPKPSWPEVKAQLNHWGQIFSSGDDSERIIATERIFSLFEQVTESAKDFDNDEKRDRWYDQAIGVMCLHFKGDTNSPLRYLKDYYPEDLFYNAILHTLGFSESGGKSGTYDATKGATYVTHFTNTLKHFCSQRRFDLNKDFDGKNHLFSINTIEAEMQELDTAPEARAIQAEEHRRQTDALVNLAMLTADMLKLDQVLFPIGDGADERVQSVKASTMQLFYSFQLVNISRFATAPVSRRDDRILMYTADEGFLHFSTQIKELAFLSLVQAELSDYVLKNKLYDVQDGQKQLQQQVAARYCNIDESALTPKFKAARRYLSRHWHYKPM